MKAKEVFELTLTQEPIFFTPVGGNDNLKKIGLNDREEIVLTPPKEQEGAPKTLNMSFFIPEKGKPFDRNVVEQWCKENGWRLATGFELASLANKLWSDLEKEYEQDKERGHNYEKLDSLTFAVALGDSYKGNYVATTVPQWDWSLTVYSPKELSGSCKFAIVKL